MKTKTIVILGIIIATLFFTSTSNYFVLEIILKVIGLTIYFFTGRYASKDKEFMAWLEEV